jgi:site-specific recombinase XerD
VAARQRSPETRRTYAAVYRSFGAFLGPDASPADVTPEAVRAYRDALEHAGRSPATVAKHLSALRGLADALSAGDPALRTVRSARVARGEPRALDHDEWQRLLHMPDRRSRQGKRDLALLHLLGSAGLRCAEASAVLVGDVDERRRSSDPRLRSAIKGSTSWWVTVRYGKRGRTRAIPLDEDTLAAITAWAKVRPTAAADHLLLSLPRTGQPPRPLGTRDIARIVEPYATAAGLPEDRRSPHVLRHTFCTHLADSGAAVIRELAGHADIRTTTIYTAVSDARLEHAIEARGLQRRGARRAAAGR